jgi:uncharacterized protein
VESDAATHADWPEGRAFTGREGVQDFFRRFMGAWNDYEVEFEDFRDAGDEVLVLVRDGGRGRASGVPVERSWAQLWTVRDGRVARFEAYKDREEAWRAAGLEPG